MNRRDFLRGLLGGAAVLTLPQTEALRRQLIEDRPLGKGWRYEVGPTEFVGRIPVRTELTVLPADAPKARKVGWTIKENVGTAYFAAPDPDPHRRMPIIDPDADDAEVVYTGGHAYTGHDCREIKEIRTSRSLASVEYANTPDQSVAPLYQAADTVDAVSDLPDTDPEQTARYVQAEAATYVRVDEIGWVRLA